VPQLPGAMAPHLFGALFFGPCAPEIVGGRLRDLAPRFPPAGCKREIARAAQWAVKWRMFQMEAIEVAGGMDDPKARHHMLIISDCYQRLAERAEERRERWVAHGAAIKRGPH
jgi:hypothetical protein